MLTDHFHHAAFGGSFLNPMYLVCACTPRYADTPTKLVARLDDQGRLAKDGAVTPDGFAVNTLFPFNGPYPADAAAAMRAVAVADRSDDRRPARRQGDRLRVEFGRLRRGGRRPAGSAIPVPS